MKVNFDYQSTMYSIEDEIARIPETLVKERKVILQKAAKLIKRNVENNLPKSDLDATNTNYDGTPYVHMKDDVKTSVKDDKAGNVYAVVKGGKYTGYKWHIVENGTSSPDRPALHFIEKAMKQSEDEINQIVDDFIKKVVSDGK